MPVGEQDARSRSDIIHDTVQSWRRCGIEVVQITRQSDSFHRASGIMVPCLEYRVDDSDPEVEGVRTPYIDGNAWKGGDIEFVPDPRSASGYVAYLPVDNCLVPPGTKSGASNGWNLEFLASHYKTLDATGNRLFDIPEGSSYKTEVARRSDAIQDAGVDVKAEAARKRIVELSDAIIRQERGESKQTIQVVAPVATGDVDVVKMLQEIRDLRAEMVELKRNGGSTQKRGRPPKTDTVEDVIVSGTM